MKASTVKKMKSDFATEHERANKAEERLLEYLIEDRRRSQLEALVRNGQHGSLKSDDR